MRTRTTLLAFAAGLLLTTACTQEATTAISVPADLPSQSSDDRSASQDKAERFTKESAADGTPLSLEVAHVIDTVDGDRQYTYLVTTAKGEQSTQDISALIDDWTAWPDRNTETSMVGVYGADGSRIGSETIESGAVK
jgi:hypothetical protein